MKRTKIGVIGCGNISAVYLQAGQKFRNLEVAACAGYGRGARAGAGDPEFKHSAEPAPVKELSGDARYRDRDQSDYDPQSARRDCDRDIAEAGKHTYGEKPLAVTREEGQKVLALAKSKNLRVGCAPDTFLGGGIQTCRKLIDDGWIGEPIGATAFMTCHGHESWHADPDFFYQPGAGPMFDMGPYYLTALAFLIGPMKRICSSARATFPERLITSQPKFGTKIKVNTPTHIAGVIDFASGAVSTMLMSFDIWHAELPRIEIYGSHGSLSVPDPNGFGGPVRVRREGAQAWSDVPLTHGYFENSRGLGVADMAQAIAAGRPHRASGELAYHVLDAMQAFLDSSSSSRHIELSSTCAQPKPLALGIRAGEID